MTESQIIVEQVINVTPLLADRIRELTQMIGQNYKTLTNNDLEEMVSSRDTILFVAKDIATDTIVGMVTLLVHRIPYAKKAVIEDLVVDEAYRGRSIGKILIRAAVMYAKKKKVAYVDCTARLRRVASNNLYEKEGFKIRDTNVYRLLFDYAEV